MIYAIVVVLVLIADQAMKYWTTKNILLGAIGDECAKLIPGFAHITNVHNYGAAFSILQNARWPLVIVTAIFVAVIIILISREIIHTPFGKWTATLVVAGAIGNCIDRILYGYVVDMFEFEFFTFPVFNIADIFITVAGILFCIHLILHNEPEEVRVANEPEFMRKRREEKEAKEAPFANIPKHGEHKSLEEVLGTYDPDDPFAEWEFGKSVEETATEEVSAEAAGDVTEPMQKTAPFAQKDSLFSDFLNELGSKNDAAAESVAADEAAPETPAAVPEPETPAAEPEDSAPVPEEPAIETELPADVTDPKADDTPVYTLEDILSEFGDF